MPIEDCAFQPGVRWSRAGIYWALSSTAAQSYSNATQSVMPVVIFHTVSLAQIELQIIAAAVEHLGHTETRIQPMPNTVTVEQIGHAAGGSNT
jgi:hypothetical protein